MKILYGIQGTGHGHISRAREILPLLAETADVDILISGYNCSMKLEQYEPVHKRGISLAYDSNGGVSYLQTALKLQPIQFLKDVHGLNLDNYDLIISDYEPVTSWAASAAKRECLGLSHQAAFLSDKTPRPEKTSLFAERILKHFAPCTDAIGFHFLRYDEFIEPPIIRRAVLKLNSQSGNHITVYLPAFDHETLASVFVQFSDVEWQIFSPLCTNPYKKYNVTINPVGNEPFLESMESAIGVLTSAGFETCAETMYLGKKLMVVPIRNQYEQLCNAAALEKLGVTVAYKFGRDFVDVVKKWLYSNNPVQLSEIADTKMLTDKLTGQIEHAPLSF